MEKITKASSVIHCVKMLLRNLMFFLYTALWLFVLYLSICEDERAAVFCYLAVALTVLAVKYAFQGIGSIGSCLIYFASFLSKKLIFTGIFLAIFPQLWDTAFYSICLGIVIQKLKTEIEVRSISTNLNLNIHDIGDDTKNDTFELKPHVHHKTSAPFHEVAKDKTLIKENNDEYSSIINVKVDSFRNTPEKLNKVTGLENVTNETQSSHKVLTKSFLGFSETANGHEERATSPNLNIKDFLEHSDKNIIKKNESLINEDESAPKHVDTFATKSRSNYESNRLEMPNVQTLELNEFPEIELDTFKVQRQNLVNDLSVFLSNFQDVVQRNNFSSLSSQSKKPSWQQDEIEHQDKFNLESVNPSKDNAHLQLHDESIDLVKNSLQNEVRLDKTNIPNTVTDAENSLTNKTIPRESSCITDANSDIQTKYASKSSPYIKIADIQPEKVNYGQIECKKVDINDGNLNTNLDVIALKELPGSENHLVSKSLHSYCVTSDFEDHSSKRNESGSNAEKRNEINELVTEESRELPETYSSDVEDVVNRIDLSFIYTLGFNVS